MMYAKKQTIFKGIAYLIMFMYFGAFSPSRIDLNAEKKIANAPYLCVGVCVYVVE